MSISSTVQSWINDAATRAGIPPSILTSLVNVESGGDQSLVSSAGAVGLTQSLPSTAANPGFGVAPWNPNDPQSNIQGGASYLAALYSNYGNWQTALSAYNVGVGSNPATNPAGLAYAQQVLTGAGFPASGGSTVVPAGSALAPASGGAAQPVAATAQGAGTGTGAAPASPSRAFYALAIGMIVVLLVGGTWGLIRAGDAAGV